MALVAENIKTVSMDDIGPEPVSLVCPFCRRNSGRTFSTRTAIGNHIRMAHGSSRFSEYAAGAFDAEKV